MIYRTPTRTTTNHSSWLPVTRLLIVIVAISATFLYLLLASFLPIDIPPLPILDRESRETDDAIPDSRMGIEAEMPRIVAPAPPPIGVLNELNGAVPDGTRVFDDEIPGIANLAPELLSALRQAATDAANDGVEFFVESGWRSPDYQNQLFREAVSTYGSEAEAARWVASAETSAHVSGDAVDIGSYDAMAWLSEHGAKYGLCQIYSNEPWHYELRPDASYYGCPPMYIDPTQDPRMQP